MKKVVFLLLISFLIFISHIIFSQGSYSITITNSQSVATPTPFQQDIAICNGNPSVGNNFAYVDNSTLFNEINSNGSNVYFTTSGSSPNIYSWYEGQENINGVSCDVWWVNLPNGIPANSQVTIYMYIGSTSANYYSQYPPYVGEAPQLSPTYAEYDNGNDVFDLYFNGNAPTGDFTLSGSGGSLSTTTTTGPNGNVIDVLDYSQSSSSISYLAYNAKSLGAGSYITETLFQSDGGGSNTGTTGLGNYITEGSGSSAIYVGTQFGGDYFDQDYLSSGSMTFDQNAQGTANSNWRYASLTYIAGSSSYYAYIAPQLYSTSGGYSGTVNANPISSATTIYWDNYADAGPGSHIYYDWVRIRAYPPNGVMPSISIAPAVSVTSVSLSQSSYTSCPGTSVNVGATSNLNNPYSQQTAVNFYCLLPGGMITISNSQSVATPAPFQQDIAVCNGNPNAGNNFAYVDNPTLFNEINSNGSNVYFTTSGSSPNIYSWYEGQDNINGVNCDVWWINLPNGIPANSNYTIYMYIGSTSANYYSQYYPYTGVSAYWYCYSEGYTNMSTCPNYGLYDNGQDVFNYYWNFAGTSLPSGWTGSGSYTVNNGLSVAYSGYAYTSSTFGYNNNSILDFYGDFPPATSTDNAAFGFVQSGTGNAGVDAGWTINTNNNQGDTTNAVGQTGLSGASGAYTTGISGGISATGYHVWTIYFPTSGYVLFAYDYVNSEKITTTLPTSAYPIGGINSQGSQATIGPFYWVRVRAYPPNGVMPSISISAINPSYNDITCSFPNGNSCTTTGNSCSVPIIISPSPTAPPGSYSIVITASTPSSSSSSIFTYNIQQQISISSNYNSGWSTNPINVYIQGCGQNYTLFVSNNIYCSSSLPVFTDFNSSCILTSPASYTVYGQTCYNGNCLNSNSLTINIDNNLPNISITLLNISNTSIIANIYASEYPSGINNVVIYDNGTQVYSTTVNSNTFSYTVNLPYSNYTNLTVCASTNAGLSNCNSKIINIVGLSNQAGISQPLIYIYLLNSTNNSLEMNITGYSYYSINNISISTNNGYSNTFYNQNSVLVNIPYTPPNLLNIDIEVCSNNGQCSSETLEYEQGIYTETYYGIVQLQAYVVPININQKEYPIGNTLNFYLNSPAYYMILNITNIGNVTLNNISISLQQMGDMPELLYNNLPVQNINNINISELQPNQSYILQFSVLPLYPGSSNLLFNFNLNGNSLGDAQYNLVVNYPSSNSSLVASENIYYPLLVGIISLVLLLV